MAIDESLFVSCQRKKSPPTIRFYGWTPPAVSLGYFQKVENAVDLKACARWGVDVVRRLSGGRAVLHHKELTYSVVCPEGTPPFTSTILETYKIISECLMSALKELSLDVKWVTFRNKHTSSDRNHKRTASCFSAPSWYEITVEDKKICGSAQKRGGGIVLQHGSILIEHDAEMLAAVLSSKKDTQALRAEVCSTTTSINCHLNKKIDFCGLKTLVAEKFEARLGITLQKGELTDYELTLKEHLLKEKYLSKEWNFRYSSPRKNNTLMRTQVA